MFYNFCYYSHVSLSAGIEAEQLRYQAATHENNTRSCNTVQMLLIMNEYSLVSIFINVYMVSFLFDNVIFIIMTMYCHFMFMYDYPD